MSYGAQFRFRDRNDEIAEAIVWAAGCQAEWREWAALKANALQCMEAYGRSLGVMLLPVDVPVAAVPVDVTKKTPVKRAKRLVTAALTSLSLVDRLDAMTGSLSISEAAELMYVDAATIYRHIKSGEFPSFNLCGNQRVDPYELARYIRSRSTPACGYGAT